MRIINPYCFHILNTSLFPFASKLKQVAEKVPEPDFFS